jgi:tetratricopeptide (TPR) repeat protein
MKDIRYILYNPDFLRKFKQDAATKWAAYSVLAHEIGHHLNGHNLSEDNPTVRKQFELEADKFAGNLLFHLHATIEEAQSGIKTIPLEGESNTHPSKTARLVATTNGWTAAYDLSRGIQPKPIEPSPSADNEKLARVWFTKALAEFDHSKEVEYYSKAIELNPNYANAFAGRGLAKEKLGEFIEAIADYDQAIRLKPNDAENYYKRGHVKKVINKFTEAIFDFDQAIRLKPNYALAFNYRGLTKKQLGKYAEAILDFDKAIQLDSKFDVAYANKGCCLVAMNVKSRMREAIDLIDKGLSIEPKMSWAQDCKTEAVKKMKE